MRQSPLLFGLQQLIEGSLWLTFDGETSHLNQILTHIYALFSHVLWPIFVPLAVLILEPCQVAPDRSHGTRYGGPIAGLYLLYFLGC